MRSGAFSREAVFRLAESDDPSRSWREATRLEIELPEVFVEVNMQPLTACSLAFGPNDLDHLCAYAPAAVRIGNHRVLNPSMRKSIPNDVGKSDEASVVSCNDPTEAVLGEEVIPVPFVVGVHPSLEGFGVEGVDLSILKGTAPFETHRHPRRISGTPSRSARS